MPPAITVESLSKVYRVHHAARGVRGYRTLREDLVSLATSPWRKARRLFGKNGSEVDGESDQTFWALNDISFDVQPGEVVGVIGHNGAGKSTLLKILSRITPPSAGHVTINGRIGTLLEVGTGFHPELTGRENIFMNGSILGMSRREIQQKYNEIVDFSGVETFLDTPVKRYSSGMQVRLAFAVAAHLDPEILIIDEVLAVGDAAFQKKCLGKMHDVAREGRTVLFVSHNMTAVEALCTRCLLIHGGRIHKDGQTGTVIAGYLSAAQTEQDGSFDLKTSPARSRHALPIITKLEMFCGERATSSFRVDDSMRMVVSLTPPRPIRDARVAISFEDHLGRRITTAATYLSQTPAFDLNAPTEAECRIDRLPLGEGRFLVSVTVSTRDAGPVDWIENAAWFDVSWYDRFGTGQAYSPWYGPVVTDSRWTVTRCPTTAFRPH